MKKNLIQGNSEQRTGNRDQRIGNIKPLAISDKLSGKQPLSLMAIRLSLLIAYNLFLITSASAQMTKVWDKDLASSYVENPVLIYKNPSGTVDVIASIAGPGTSPVGNAAGNDVTTGYGEYDYWFCKLNKNGQKISNSDVTYGGTLTDQPLSAVKAPDGGYLICGSSNSSASGNKTSALPAANGTVLWTVKIDSMGTLQWQQQVAFSAIIGNGGTAYVSNAVVSNTYNGYAIALTISTNTSHGTFYFTYLAELDMNGNVLSSPVQISFSSSVSSIIIPKTIIQLSSGNLLIGGIIGSSGIEMLLTSTGTVISSHQYTSSGTCEIISAKELSANGNWLFFAKSIHNNASGFTRTVNSKASAGNYDIWVFQTDNTGTILSGQNAIGCGSLNLADHTNISEVANISYCINSAGPMAYLLLEPDASGDDRAETGKGFTDYWLVQYDYINNVIVQENSFGGSNAEQVQSLFVDDGANAYLLGTSTSPISGDKSEALKSGTSDLWAVRTCLGTDAVVIANATYRGHAFPRGYWVYPCSDLIYTLNISNPQSYNAYKWYDAASGGNLLGTGTGYTVLNLASTTQTIWVEADNGTCLSARSEVIISPIPTPAPPTYSGSTLICKGTQLVLAGQMNITGQLSGSYYKFHWRDGSLNHILSENDTLKINNCTSPFTVWLSVLDSMPANPSIDLPLTMCESAPQQISISIDSAPSPIVSYTNPTCVYDSTILTVTNASSYTVNWYDALGNLVYTGNPFLYTGNVYPVTFYCELVTIHGCRSVRTSSVINATHASPNPPSIQDTYTIAHHAGVFFPTCSNFSTTININQANSAYVYNWYDGNNNLLGAGNSYTSPAVNYNGYYEYWVSANDGTCVSDKTDIHIEPIKTPGTPQMLSTATQICKNDTLVLIANKDTSTQAGGNFFLRWYNAANQLVHTGDTLVIPNMQIASAFYCSEVDSIPYNYFPALGYYLCEGQRTSQFITVDSAPAPIITYTNPVCIYNNTTLSITNGSGYYVNWYNKSGTVINTGNPFIYSNSTSADTIYCTITSGFGCVSRKTQVIINVQHALPSVPVIQNTFAQSLTELFPTCSNSSAQLNINLPNSSYLYDWYNSPIAGNIVNVGVSNTIPSVNYNAIYEYWVCANDGTCTGNRQDVKIRPIKTPGLPQIISTVTHICRFDTLILIAAKDTSTQAGGKFFLRWYNGSNQLLHTGDTLIVPDIQNASTFYCSEVDSVPYNYFSGLGAYLCEGKKTSRQINIDTVSNPNVSVPSPVCAGVNIVLNVTNVVNSTIHWFKANGSFLSIGASYTIPHIETIDTVLAQALGTNTCKSRVVQTIVVPQKPAGDFMSVKTILNSGDVIQFNNLTAGGSTWYWDFGDGSNSTSQSPHHYFYNPGYYTITLIATSIVGCIDTVTKNNYIQVLLGSGVNEYSILKDVQLFPNPTSGIFSIQVISDKGIANSQIEIYNIYGECIYEQAISDKGTANSNNPNGLSRTTINLSEAKNGIYILQIMKDNEKVNIKIIKE